MKLLLHEWVVVVLLSMFIFLIISVSHFQAYLYPQRYLKASPIAVTVTGAIKSPGKYLVYPGVSLKEVLKKAGIIDKTDQKQISMERQLFKSEEVYVPTLESIVVKVRGAVDEKTLHLKPGTRICSLKKHLLFRENADLSGLNSRKKLYDGQTVTIGYIH